MRSAAQKCRALKLMRLRLRVRAEIKDGSLEPFLGEEVSGIDCSSDPATIERIFKIGKEAGKRQLPHRFDD